MYIVGLLVRGVMTTYYYYVNSVVICTPSVLINDLLSPSCLSAIASIMVMIVYLTVFTSSLVCQHI